MFHGALIINLEVPEGGLFALVLGVLFPRCVMVAAVCAMLYRSQVLTLSPGQGGLSRCMPSWACPGFICSL